MEVSFTCSEKVAIKSDGKQRKLRLRMNGGAMEWDLWYTTELKSEALNTGIGIFYSGSQQFQAIQAHCLHSTIKLVPVHGANFMRTTSYRVTLDVESGANRSHDSLVVNKDYSFRITPASREKRLGDILTIVIGIRLKGGQVTSISNSNRLFNSREHSDIELRCGDDLVIPAHKHVLSYHSETFRTAFSSTSFVEGKEGVYVISSEHMSPDTLQDVIRYQQGFWDPQTSYHMVPVPVVLIRILTDLYSEMRSNFRRTSIDGFSVGTALTVKSCTFFML
jgi:hypothetical protein